MILAMQGIFIPYIHPSPPHFHLAHTPHSLSDEGHLSPHPHTPPLFPMVGISLVQLQVIHCVCGQHRGATSDTQDG